MSCAVLVTVSCDGCGVVLGADATPLSQPGDAVLQDELRAIDAASARAVRASIQRGASWSRYIVHCASCKAPAS